MYFEVLHEQFLPLCSVGIGVSDCVSDLLSDCWADFERICWADFVADLLYYVGGISFLY